MAKGAYQSMKILLLYETLRLNSDEQRMMSTNEIIDVVKTCKKIDLDRKAVYNGVKTINDYFKDALKYDDDVIAVEGGNPNRYYFKRRELKTREIRFLLDAVQSASFIPQDMALDLCDDVATLAGDQQASALMENTVYFDKTKHKNAEVFDTLDAIISAIEKGKKIMFRYFNLDLNMTRVFKYDGKIECNPVGLVFLNGYYYLECYTDAEKKLKSYRVDRMCDCEVAKGDVSPARCADDFKNGSLKDRLTAFSMWNGKEERVTIHAKRNCLGDIYDKFGEGVNVDKIDENTVSVKVDVNLSPVFYGWVASYGKDMKIVKPQDAVNLFIDLISQSLEQYKKDGEKS